MVVIGSPMGTGRMGDSGIAYGLKDREVGMSRGVMSESAGCAELGGELRMRNRRLMLDTGRVGDDGADSTGDELGGASP